MRRYLYIVHGWPIIATEGTQHLYSQRARLVGVYDDERELLATFRSLLSSARPSDPPRE